jgi:AmiR/NasT family two-component response regulator
VTAVRISTLAVPTLSCGRSQPGRHGHKQLTERIVHLEEAANQRDTVALATGLLLAIHEINADVARSMLAHFAQREGVTVFDRAATVIASEPSRRAPS